MGEVSQRVWHLLYTKPRQEAVALENLQRQGYHAWLPRVRVKKRRQRRLVEAVEPMFPRYLFIRLDQVTDNWGPIRSTLGVCGVVRFGHYYPEVPIPFIEALQRDADEHGIRDLTGADTPQPGERVVVAEGPLAGYQGVLQARTGKDRVRVLLDVVCGGRAIDLPASVLARVT